ncbi:MAG: actin, cytoplasmic 2 [Candidatus Hodarchaeota archaeon]
MKPAIVIDNGTGYSKNGFGGENQPRSVFSTLIGYPKQKIDSNLDKPVREYYVGTEALKLSGILKLQYPIDYRTEVDWSALEDIWQYTFQEELRVDPSEHPVLLMEPPLNPRHYKDKMAEIMFETFNVPALYIFNQAIFSLYASGRTTGLLVEIGESSTYIVPIFEGFSLLHAVKRLDLGGRDITKFLCQLLNQRGYIYTYSDIVEREWVREIKEKCCYVALDPGRELKLAENSSGKRELLLPYGETIKIGSEACLAPEVFFNPTILEREDQSLHECINSSIQECDIDLRLDLYQNIVFSGGSTLFPGLKERLHKELTELVSPRPEPTVVRIISLPEPQNSAWYGGSLFSSMEPFQQRLVTKETYRNFGYRTYFSFRI